MRAAWLAAVGLAGCMGSIPASDMGSDPDSPAAPAKAVKPADPAADPATNPAVAAQLAGRDLAAVSGLRRLTVYEYDSTLRDLLLDISKPSGPVIPEGRTPFDNDYLAQDPTKTLVEGAELLAKEASARLMADLPRRDKVVGCKPAGVKDEACFRQFVKTFGRRALHRTVPDDEVTRYVQLLSLTSVDGSFYTAIDAAIRVFLQHPEFLYRVEVGTPVAGSPGLYKLNAFEVAARLSYFLQGTTPDETLLARAEGGRLETADDIRAAVTDMLANAKTRDQIVRFHAQWMAYESLPHPPALAKAMQTETSALIGRVLFDRKGPWQDLLRSTETYVSDVLVKQYGLDAPGTLTAPAWVPYGASGRRGLLSQGAFLALGNKFDDTSPTVRGKEIRERLFCEDIPPPPENVNADAAPVATGTAVCKWDRYAAHRVGGCAGCHEQMDPIGFGLENYDSQGRYRTREVAQPQCQIEGKGEIVGLGAFHGPVELSDLMLNSGRLNRCVVAQLYRFATGRPHAKEDEIDKQAVAMLTKGVGDKDFRLDKLILDFTTAAAFAHRREGR